MKTAWFKKGKTRINIRPITWQGWIILLTFIFLIIFNYFRLGVGSHSAPNTFQNFALQGLFLGLLYFLTANNLADKD